MLMLEFLEDRVCPDATLATAYQALAVPHIEARAAQAIPAMGAITPGIVVAAEASYAAAGPAVLAMHAPGIAAAESLVAAMPAQLWAEVEADIVGTTDMLMSVPYSPYDDAIVAIVVSQST